MIGFVEASKGDTPKGLRALRRAPAIPITAELLRGLIVHACVDPSSEMAACVLPYLLSAYEMTSLIEQIDEKGAHRVLRDLKLAREAYNEVLSAFAKRWDISPPEEFPPVLVYAECWPMWLLHAVAQQVILRRVDRRVDRVRP